MKWVTRDHIHMDRVASPWLILRHIDPEGEIGFLPFDDTYHITEGTVPFAIPGVELAQQKPQGWSFRQLLRNFTVMIPATNLWQTFINLGCYHCFNTPQRIWKSRLGG